MVKKENERALRTVGIVKKFICQLIKTNQKINTFLALQKNLANKTHITAQTEIARPVKFDEGLARPLVFEGCELKDVISETAADSNVANSAGIETSCYRSNG